MVKPIEKRIQQHAYAVIAKQILSIPFVASIVWVLVGQKAAISLLLGGLAYAIPDLLFIWRFVRYSGTSAINSFITRFFTGKMVKLILRSALVIYLSVQLPVDKLWLFVGFMSCTFLFWTACMMHFTRQRGTI